MLQQSIDRLPCQFHLGSIFDGFNSRQNILIAWQAVNLANTPRRLRSDADGNLWITAFPESAIYRYEPAAQRFTRFELPVLPKGSETPYALNVDKRRGIVWVNGNQSDSLYALEIASGNWRRVPLPRRVAFTRDIEIAADGTVYTSTSSFPSWHVEDGQPTLIRVQTKAP